MIRPPAGAWGDSGPDPAAVWCAGGPAPAGVGQVGGRRRAQMVRNPVLRPRCSILPLHVLTPPHPNPPLSSRAARCRCPSWWRALKGAELENAPRSPPTDFADFVPSPNLDLMVPAQIAAAAWRRTRRDQRRGGGAASGGARQARDGGGGDVHGQQRGRRVRRLRGG